MNCRLLYIITFHFMVIPVFSNILQVDQITTKDGLPVNAVQSIQQDKYGFIWLSSFASLCKYDGYSFKQYFPEIDNKNTIFSTGIYNLALDTLDQLWIGFFDTTIFCKYNYMMDNFTRVPSFEVAKYVKDRISRSRDPIRSVQSKTREIWRIDNGKIISIQSDNVHSTTYCLGYTMNQPINEELISCMFIDNNNILWIGSEVQGVFRINTQTQPFYAYKVKSELCKDDPLDIIRSIYDDQENHTLWLGTQSNGLIAFDKITGNYEYLVHIPGNNNSICENEIRSLLKDSRNVLWIGTKGGLSMLNTRQGTFRHYTRYTENQIPNPWVHTFIEDHEGFIWIGTYHGLIRYDPTGNMFEPLDPSYYLRNSRVSGIVIDRKNNLWVSTQGGGITYLKRTSIWDRFDTVHYLNIPDNPKSLSSNRVLGLINDIKGNIWAATDQGISIIQKDTREIKRIGFNDGLPDIVIVGILVDNHGNIWASHKKGLTQINTQTMEMIHFSEQDGLQSNNFQEKACYKNPRTGELFFGNDKGLVSFFPDSIITASTIPKVYITSLHILNREVKAGDKIENHTILNKSIQFTERIALKSRYKSFSIEFTGLQYASPQTNKFAYQLEGFENTWIETSASHRLAAYSNLSPGKYLFKVKAANGAGKWSPEHAQLWIVVKPPWWNTIVAYMVYIFIISGILYWIYSFLIAKERYKQQVRYEKMKAAKLMELDELKMQFFTNISHELRTPLSLLIDPIRKLYKGNVNNKDLKFYYGIIHNNAQRLLKLVNQILDFRKIEKKPVKDQIKQKNLSLFLANLSEAFKIQAQEQHITFTYISKPEKIIAVFDPEKLEKVILNLLSNAFKFTPRGKQIMLALQYSDLSEKHFEIKVTDQGRGIAKEELAKIFDAYYQIKYPGDVNNEGSGIGLAFAKELVESMKGKIEAESEPGIETTFRITIPVGDIETDTDHKESDTRALDAQITFEDERIMEEEDNYEQDRSTILVVDDNEEVRLYLKNELRNEYRILEAADGQEGLDKTRTSMPDLVISDVMMPVMDGFEFCRELKSDVRISHIPVILLTAKDADNYIIRGFETGADAYIIKPFNTNVLLVRIKNLIETRNKLRENFLSTPFIDIKKIASNQADENFINQLIDLVHKNISDPEFNFDLLKEKLKISRKQLSHKVKTLTGKTVNEFVRYIRLNKAADLLISTDLNISEVAYELGYNVPTNFTRSFHQQFGLTPSEFIAQFEKGKK